MTDGVSFDGALVERAGVVVGCALVAVFVVALLADLAGSADARTTFAVVVLALGVVAGVVVATTEILAYETVWAFALGAWLSAIPLVTFDAQVRVLVLVAFDAFLQPDAYRVLVLALAGVGGALVTVLYDRYA